MSIRAGYNRWRIEPAMATPPVRLFLLVALAAISSFALPSRRPRFRVLVVVSKAKDHQASIKAAGPFFQQMAKDNNLAIDFTDDADTINDRNLKRYKVFVMFHLAPFDMTSSQQAALQKFIEEGHGWVGVHAAGLTGREFLAPDTTYWQWFEDFLGGVTYLPHPYYQKGTLVIQDHDHPATRNLPDKFEISDEWYEWNHSPRDKVRVLAVADESTYHPHVPMGDHPMVWTNEKYRRMIYLCVGHDPSALSNPWYSILLRDSILWAGS
jgi:type 1 glutamine amidotransferase